MPSPARKRPLTAETLNFRRLKKMRSNDDSSQDGEDSEAYNPAEASGSSKRRTNNHSEWEQSQRDILTKLLAEQRPPITEGDYDIVLGPTEPEFDEWWTEEDERLMMQEWNKAPENGDMEQMRAGHTKPWVMELWKIDYVFVCTVVRLWRSYRPVVD